MSTHKSIYLDYAATAPLDQRVWEAMKPFVFEQFGNASSLHGPGRRARHAVEESREHISSRLGCDPSDVIFTGSGTEANNLALSIMSRSDAYSKLVTSQAEHEAVRQPALYLEKLGVQVGFVDLDQGGSVSVESMREELSEDQCLVSLMYVNNETGAVTDVGELALVAKSAGSMFHTDAVQAGAYFNLSDAMARVDMLSISAHKLGGPKGVGALIVKNGLVEEPLIRGGSQERRRRAGTENVSGIVGLAKALSIAQDERPEEMRRVEALKQKLIAGLVSALGPYASVTTPNHSAPHIVHIIVVDEEGSGLDGEMLILGLDLEGVHVSSGSACTSGALEPSHVLQALGVESEIARGAIRFSIGKNTSEEDIVRAVEATSAVVSRVGSSINSG